MDFLGKSKKYLYISLAIHALLLVSLGLPSLSDMLKGEHERLEELPKHQPIQVNVEIISASDAEDPIYIKDEDEIGEGEKKEQKKEDCTRHYGGIGVNIVIDWNEYFETGYVTVSEVHFGYPAYEAGIQVGDRLKNADGGRIQGEVGTEVKIIILRGSRKYKTTITRGKICTK